MSKKPVILCVDDESIVLVSIRDQLKKYFKNKIAIETAESGEEALEIIDELIAEKKEPPIVISDQIMPGMKGVELLTKVHEKLPNTNTILLTGLAIKEDIIDAVNNANLYRFIPKPWDKMDLNLTVKEAINSFFQSKKIVDKNVQLNRTNRKLKQTNEELDTFLYKASHDLKGPVATLKGLCQLGLLEKDYHYFKKQEFVLTDMTSLLSKIVKVGEIRKRKKLVEITNLKNFMAQTCLEIQEEVKDKGIELILNIHQDALIETDLFLLRSILYNVIKNAYQYSFIPYSEEKRFVKIEAQKDIRGFHIKVTNNGIGIPHQLKNKVFYMFYKANDRNPGDGLGLYISKVAIENLGGKIKLKSTESENTCFEIFVPLPGKKH
ncbi:hybrid sensor histidine kinase/response regulator [Fulvivirgaceae bacterium BMA10]|uniref:histidine kinase n=1 Tax=Splendidivirga corallicola TaxID=3051826 RepID=A0ABT8KK42_9BACT|nr:hybrid sensor histidine kinase/response regulator [Fulvivirgaceae bacterium BMA10]